jgi:hypothetical protein
MFALPEVRESYYARMRELSNTLFLPERFSAQLQEISAAIRPAILVEPPKQAAARATTELQTAIFDGVISGETRLMPFVRERAKFVQAELLRLGK